MKRWDLTTIATNLGQQIQWRYGQVHGLMAPYLKTRHKENAPKTAIEKLLIEIFEHVEQMHLMSDIVVGAASSRYPLHGVQPWMLEGEYASIKHPFEEGLNRQMLMGAIVQELANRLQMAYLGINGMAKDLPDNNQEVGLLRMGILQWANCVESLSKAFAQFKPLLFGGALDAFDWREMDVLKLLPEPTKSRVEARLEVRFLQQVQSLNIEGSKERAFEYLRHYLEERNETMEQFLARAIQLNEMKIIDIDTHLAAIADKTPPPARRPANKDPEKDAGPVTPEPQEQEEAPKKISKKRQKALEQSAKRKEVYAQREAERQERAEAKRQAEREAHTQED